MKLQALEDSYAQRAEEENRRYQQTLEERMAAFQRESESRYKRQLEVEMAHFREREVAEMRVEERERFQEEVGRMRSELHGVYQQKMEGVRKIELETLERLRRKEQVRERLFRFVVGDKGYTHDCVCLPCNNQGALT